MSGSHLTVRAFADADIPALKAFLHARDPEHAPPDYWHAGKSAVGTFQAVLDSPASHHQLWLDDTGDIHALTWVCPEPPATVEGAPKAWRHLAHPAYRAEADLSRAIHVAEQTLAGPTPIATAAYSGDAWLCARLREAGYRRGRVLDVYMSRNLYGTLPALAAPAGYEIRPFDPAHDLTERAGAQRDAFAGVPAAGEPEADEWSINNVHRFTLWAEGREQCHLVAVTPSGEVASFALFTVDSVLGVGELDPVGTRGTHQRRGLSRALLRAGLQYLQEAGMHRAVVRTGVANLSAIALYESVGFEITDYLYEYTKLA